LLLPQRSCYTRHEHMLETSWLAAAALEPTAVDHGCCDEIPVFLRQHTVRVTMANTGCRGPVEKSASRGRRSLACFLAGCNTALLPSPRPPAPL
jgi:hypothetical protein